MPKNESNSSFENQPPLKIELSLLLFTELSTLFVDKFLYNNNKKQFDFYKE
jgi:hypothetical protein